MAYNILGINPFHNGSVCVLSEGEIVYFLEEERLSKYKYDANPFRVILDVLNRFKIDEVAIAGINSNNTLLNFTLEDPFYALIRKFYPNIKIYKDYSDFHHEMHLTTAFINSGFDKAIGIVIDNGGSYEKNLGKQVDSVYKIFKENLNPSPLYKFRTKSLRNIPFPLSIASVWNYITIHLLGFKNFEEGKTMGLSSYGKFNPIIPNFFDLKKNQTNIDIFYSELNEKFNLYHYLTPKAKKLLNINLKKTKSLEFTQVEKDLAWYAQDTLQKFVKNLVTKSIEKTNIKNIVCSGEFF
jgi:carbamoyltransferase